MKAVTMGAVAGVAVAMVCAMPMLEAVTALRQARTERAAIEARVARPVMRALGAAAAPDAAAARTSVAAQVRRAAQRGGVLIERIESRRQPVQSRLVVLRVVASGSEKAVLVLGDSLGSDARPARWRRWRLVALPGGAVRLDGELLGPWQ